MVLEDRDSWRLTNGNLPLQVYIYIYVLKIHKHTHIRLLVTPLPASLRFLPCLCDSFSQPSDCLLICDLAISSEHFFLLPSAPLSFQRGSCEQPRYESEKVNLFFPKKELYVSLWGRSINSFPLLQCMRACVVQC